MRKVDVELTAKQLEVINNLQASTIWLRGGMRSGKTYCGAHWIFDRSRRSHPDVQGMMVSPNYPMLQIGPRPALEAVFRQMGVRWKYKGGTDKYYTWWSPRGVPHRIWARSADKPSTISGGTVGFAWADEPGLCDEELFFRLATRVSDAKAPFLQKLFTGTPEGKRNWFHTKTSEAQTGGDPANILVAATTYDNTFNHASYFADIERTFANDPAGRLQYVLGVAADKQGNIYTNLNPQRHFRPCLNPQAGQLVVGWDFNNHVMPTPLATWFPSSGVLHIWGEVVTQGDAQTEPHAQAVIRALNKRVGVNEVYEGGKLHLVDHSGRPVLAFIDASANHKRTTPMTDRQLIDRAGFSIRSANSNPQVRDRIASVQYAFAHDKLFIDEKNAPLHARAFQEHDRDKYGEPSKSTGPGDGEFQADHFCDAGGYMVVGLTPIASRNYKPSTGDDERARLRSVTSMVFGG